VCKALVISIAVHLTVASALRDGSPARRALPDRPIEARLVESVPYALQPSTPATALEHAYTPLPATTPPTIATVAPKHAFSEVAPAAPAANTPDSRYYSARELDIYPAPVVALVVPYPPKAAAEGVAGHALLTLTLDATGKVTDVTIMESAPAGYFEEDAVQTMRSTRFTPAYKGGRAVKSRIVVALSYGSDESR
jgi:periplasmic protein TonB